MAPISAMIFDPLVACFCILPRENVGHQNSVTGKEACKCLMLTLDLDQTKIPGPFYRAFRGELGLEMDFFDNYGNRFPVIVKKSSSDKGTFVNGIKSIIMDYEIKHCALLKGTYVGPNRVSFSVLKSDMNPIKPPKKNRTMHGLCISDMGCVNRLQTEFSTHRRIQYGDGIRRRVHFDMSEPTLGSIMASDMLGCMNSGNGDFLSQSAFMLNQTNGQINIFPT
ncbi:hypothetical protein PIB30_040666 [Stylosanthes scabra]|uniref:Uncharacterized protein n=1 Tax=Stylosanthes scabra TaxID=79078 RepID=A0ABU6ZDC4_9FABA|nr:hypothetical protein [Stylosanthes scabra]